MATCYFLATETGQCPEFQVELILKVNYVRSSTEYSVKVKVQIVERLFGGKCQRNSFHPMNLLIR